MLNGDNAKTRRDRQWTLVAAVVGIGIGVSLNDSDVASLVLAFVYLCQFTF